MRGVYFIHAPAAGLVKIGSAVNIYQRFRNLELASPVALTFLGWSAGDATTERRLHRQFASLRAHGEWFTWSQDIIAAIEAWVSIESTKPPRATRSVTPVRSAIIESARTQTEFAKRIGISHAQLSRIISGKSRASLNVALKISVETGGAVQPRDLPQGEAA